MSRPRVTRCYHLANRVVTELTTGERIVEAFDTWQEAADYVETVKTFDALMGKADA